MLHNIFPHKFDITYRATPSKNDDYAFIFRGESLFCRRENGHIVFPLMAELKSMLSFSEDDICFMFRIDEADYYEICGVETDGDGEWEYVPKNEIRSMTPDCNIFAAVTGFHLHSWYNDTVYCSRCGGKLVPSSRERAMRCPDCKKSFYPKISPCVIVGVTNGEKLLLTMYAGRDTNSKRYALVAGYVEVGESLEDTVRREVMEEVGLKVKNIRYFASQPWAYSETVLMGFFCDVDGDEKIILDENELAVARWIERKDIPKESANSSVSLTGTMIKAFRDRIV